MNVERMELLECLLNELVSGVWEPTAAWVEEHPTPPKAVVIQQGNPNEFVAIHHPTGNWEIDVPGAMVMDDRFYGQGLTYEKNPEMILFEDRPSNAFERFFDISTPDRNWLFRDDMYPGTYVSWPEPRIMRARVKELLDRVK